MKESSKSVGINFVRWSSHNTWSLSTVIQELSPSPIQLRTENFLIDTFHFRQNIRVALYGDRYRCYSRFQYIIPDIKLQIWAQILSELITNIEKLGTSSSKYLRCEMWVVKSVKRATTFIMINIIGLSLWPLLKKNKSRDSYKIQIIFSSKCEAWKPGWISQDKKRGEGNKIFWCELLKVLFGKFPE